MTGNSPQPSELAKENPPRDEQRHIDSLIQSLGGKMERDYAGKRCLRDAHPKMHGCVRAEFEVAANLDPELRVGLFREPGVYPTWIRFSNQNNTVVDDNKGDIRGVALKLMGVPGEKLLDGETASTTHDFILISENRFVTRDVAEFDGLVKALISGTFSILWFFLTHPRAFWNLMTSLKHFSNPLGIEYFSVSPYLFGTRAVKYALRPHQPGSNTVPPNATPNYLRQAMAEHLNDREAAFDFLVQFQTDAVKMPIEDPGIAWDEAESPFRKVATLRIGKQTFDTPQRDEFGDNLSFNPWRCLPEHRPLGGINRARRQVYAALSKLRHEKNAASREEPSPDPV